MARIQITDEIYEELKRLREESGMSGMSLLKGRKDIPDGLHSGIVNSWLTKNSSTARQEHLKYVLNAWRNADPIIPFTKAMRQSYLSEIERTGIKHMTLVRMLNSHGIGMKPHMLSNRLSGRNKTIAKSEYKTTLRVLKSLPSK